MLDNSIALTCERKSQLLWYAFSLFTDVDACQLKA